MQSHNQVREGLRKLLTIDGCNAEKASRINRLIKKMAKEYAIDKELN